MDAIITVDKDQRIIVFNAAAEKIFCCPAVDAIGQYLDRFIPERFREAHHSHVQRFGSTGATGRTMYFPESSTASEPTERNSRVEASISQATISGEKLFTVILRDITQRKQTEAALMRSEKLATVGRLAATVAHEVNNPLEAIANLLYLAEHNPSLDEAAREHLRMAEAEVTHAAHIVKQTLGFSKGGAVVSRFSPGDVLTSVLALLESKLRNKDVVCEKEFSRHVEICGVESEIRQILWNLLINSLDAVPTGGRIRLRVSASRRNGGVDGVRVTVGDNGGGISADHMSRLFEPFFTTKETGNGLGLWITNEIVKKHGGAIRVRSRKGGERTGTAFYFSSDGGDQRWVALAKPTAVLRPSDGLTGQSLPVFMVCRILHRSVPILPSFCWRRRRAAPAQLQVACSPQLLCVMGTGRQSSLLDR